MTTLQEDILSERLSICEKRLDSFATVEDLLSRISNIEEKVIGTKEVLTLEEASAFLGVSKSQIYKLTRTASIPHYKPNGKYIYFDREELVDWVKQNHVKTRKQHELDALRYVTNNPIRNFKHR